MRTYNTKINQRKPLLEKMNRWLGLNTLVSPTQIKATELSEAVDIQLVEDGKVKCPRDGQAYFGNSSGSRVLGLYPAYFSDGTIELLRTVGTALQKYNSGTGDWDTVSGKTFTTGLPTQALVAYDNLYIANGTDSLTYYNGTDITTFTAITKPNASTVTRTAGSAGTYTYSYKITAVSAVGETDPSDAGTQTLDVAELDATHYFTVSWDAVTSAVGYNVYGRRDGVWGFMAYVDGQASVSYIDQGATTPSAYFVPPEGNSTGGQVGAGLALYKDTLFVSRDPSNPSRLYYSGGGDKINDFTIENGGGFIDISKNDGQKITGTTVFKNSLIVFKTDSIYKFTFGTTGLPQVELINPSVGAIAPRSIVSVENDVFFASRRGIFTIGNEAGFSFDVLRTNELSARVRSVYQTIDVDYIQNIAAVYATVANKNLVIFSYTESGNTTNTKALVYDRERLGWYKWTNINANCWATYISGETRILYGDDSSGYVKEILTGSTDFNSVIQGTFRLRAEDFEDLSRYKTLKNVTVVLREPTGTVTLDVIKDGVTTSYSANISTISPSINFAHYVFNRFLFKESYGTGVSSQDNNIARVLKNINILGRSFMLEFSNGSGTGAGFTLLDVKLEAKPKSEHYHAEGEVINV